MSARGFRSVGWVAGVASTALGCYMVSLQVASTRSSLEDVETQIVIAQRDIRVLQTEIGTRGRLAQLEKWNAKVLALSAPQANQFLEGGFSLAAMVAPKKAIDPAAPVVLASAPATATPPVLGAPAASGPAIPAGVDAKNLMHVASMPRELPQREARIVAANPAAARTKADPATKPISTRKAEQKTGKPPATNAGSADRTGKSVKPKSLASKSAIAPAAKTTKPKEAKPKQ